MKIKVIYLALLATIIAGCGTSRKSARLIGDSYNVELNKTTLVMFPYEDMEIQGKWTIKNIVPSSGQIILTTGDSTAIAIAKNPGEKYSFYSDSKSELDLVIDFYNWETSYWEAAGYSFEKLVENSQEKFIVCKLITKDFDNIFLFGIKNNIMMNYMIASKWDEKEEIEFLELLFINN